MAPIHLAIAGLSSQRKTSWAAEGHLPYLLSPRGKARFEIVALLNSSIKAAEAAREDFGLPTHVKPYGDPAALAADPDVDLVVVCTRVDTHAAVARPQLEAGKAIYVEWPVAASAAASRALLDPGTNERYKAALERSVIGLQGHATPILTRVKEVLDSGRIGKVLGSEAKVYANVFGRDSLPEGLAYLADREVGGSHLTITYGHAIDYIQDVLGDLEPATVKSTSAILRPEVAILGSDGTALRTVRSDNPDFVVVSGHLQDIRARGRVVPGAPLVVTMRTGPPFQGQPSFEWSINGEKGELLLTSPMGPYIFSGYSYDVRPRIQVHDHATDEVADVEWEWSGWQEEMFIKGRVVGGIYERYAAWWENGQPPANELPEAEHFPRLLDAQVRMDHLERILRDLDDQVQSLKN